MRIFKYLFFTSVLLGLVTLVLFVIAQEILLFWGGHTLRSAMDKFDESPSGDLCQTYLTQYSHEVRVVYQVRFLSNTKFVTEAICKPFNSNPSEIASFSLPPFVSKIPGSSGLIWDTDRSGVGITVFSNVYQAIETYTGINTDSLSRERYIFVEGRNTFTEYEPESFGSSPAASCEAFGYVCCDTISEIGQGDQLLKANSCEKTCFSSCVRRPIVLSFMSDPFPDLQTRTVSVVAGNPIEFQFFTDIHTAISAKSTLDFGDGKQVELEESSGTLSHVYSCPQQECIYTATVSTVDDKGNASIVTPISQLIVKVSR